MHWCRKETVARIGQDDTIAQVFSDRRASDHPRASRRTHPTSSHLCLRAQARQVANGPRLATPFHRAGRGFRKRSEGHTSELPSLIRITDDVFCLTIKKHRYI